MEKHETVGQHFAGYFTSEWDGCSYRLNTENGKRAADDFYRLTNGTISWYQVHGDFKDAAKRALFNPYPHWEALHECCRRAINAHTDLETDFVGDLTCANIMRDAMTVLRADYGYNVPRWWLPLMDRLRGKDHQVEKQRGKLSGQMKVENGCVVRYYPGRDEITNSSGEIRKR